MPQLDQQIAQLNAQTLGDLATILAVTAVDERVVGESSNGSTAQITVIAESNTPFNYVVTIDDTMAGGTITNKCATYEQVRDILVREIPDMAREVSRDQECLRIEAKVVVGSVNG